MKRTLIAFVVCCICMSLAVPYVSATSFDSLDNNSSWFDLYPYLNSSYFSLNDSLFYDIVFPDAPKSKYYYVDLLFYTDSPLFHLITNSEYLTVVNIHDDLYRAYGKLFSPNYVWSPGLNFYSEGGSYLSIISVKASLYDFNYYEIPYSYFITNRSYSGTFNHSVGAGSVKADLDMGISDLNRYSSSSFYIMINPYNDDLRKYDYLNFNFSLTCANIYSIRCIQDHTSIDFSTNYINLDGGSANDTRYLQISVDLSKFDKSSSYPLSIYIDGAISEHESSFVYFNTAIAFLSVNDNSIQSWLSTLFVNLRSWFSIQFTKLDQVISELKILNGRDSEAVSAHQTQEEINVSVNNQLVGAVEDWNTNIEVVETGYDLAVSKTTPALVWLSSLADGIFNGMGWFGNVYFLVGLISVLMLLLSKSGLASKIGSISRRRGD